MKHDEFQAAWEDALRSAGVLTPHDAPDERVELSSMSRMYRLRLGAFQNQPAEPFTGSVEIKWEWDALLSARTRTTEHDVLTELCGRTDGRSLKTEQPWLRVDIKLQGKLAWGTELTLAGAETWRAWVAAVKDTVRPLPSSALDDGPQDHAGPIDCWLGEPEAHIRCGPAGQLALLSVEFAAWQAIHLPRHLEGRDDEYDHGPEEQLEELAICLGKALAAWKQSLTLLLPRATRFH